MSGIVGIFHRDGQPVDPADLRRMVDILAHRGPDGAAIWHDGSVGLGHLMLQTTPESLHEILPWTNGRGDLTITADARIDNRDELFRRLRLDDRPRNEVPDSHLILAAYEKWGENCPDYLLGDFAFAVWDGREQRLFCARDHFGVRPFYYHTANGLFLFASEIKSLFTLGAVPDDVDEIQIGDFLTGLFESTERTFYPAIRRLSPGYALSVNRFGVKLWPYWSLDMPGEMVLGSDEAYVAAFRELFEEAVRCRLRSDAPAGLLLSGGLDSSALAVVADKILGENGQAPLHTFSGIFDEVPECDERPYIRATLDGKNALPRLIRADTVGPLTDIERVLWHQDEPFHAPHLFMQWHLLKHASVGGCRLMLDGHDGDTTISHGYGLLPELARSGQWLALATNLHGLAKANDERFVPVFLAYIWRLNLRRSLLRFRPTRKMHQIWKSTFSAGNADGDEADLLPPWSPPITEEFARATELFDRYEAWNNKRPERAPTERERHYRSVIDRRQAAGLEVLNKTGAAFGLEFRHPFWDRRLVEFCIALPAEQKLQKGWGRLILRRAVEGELAAEVCWRRDKTNFLPSFSHGLLSLQREQLDMLFHESTGAIENYVEPYSLRRLYERVKREPNDVVGYNFYALWQAVSLALWIENRSKLSGSRSPKEVTTLKQVRNLSVCRS